MRTLRIRATPSRSLPGAAGSPHRGRAATIRRPRGSRRVAPGEPHALQRRASEERRAAVEPCSRSRRRAEHGGLPGERRLSCEAAQRIRSRSPRGCDRSGKVVPRVQKPLRAARRLAPPKADQDEKRGCRAKGGEGIEASTRDAAESTSRGAPATDMLDYRSIPLITPFLRLSSETW